MRDATAKNFLSNCSGVLVCGKKFDDGEKQAQRLATDFALGIAVFSQRL
jgi:hypothetical protein